MSARPLDWRIIWAPETVTDEELIRLLLADADREVREHCEQAERLGGER